eukprot:2727845-Pleurochrysis_carterae.AAC.1
MQDVKVEGGRGAVQVCEFAQQGVKEATGWGGGGEQAETGLSIRGSAHKYLVVHFVDVPDMAPELGLHGPRAAVALSVAPLLRRGERVAAAVVTAAAVIVVVEVVVALVVVVVVVAAAAGGGIEGSRVGGWVGGQARNMCVSVTRNGDLVRRP